MAIVRTTPGNTANGSDDGDDNPLAGKQLDRTKSVINQGGRPLARPSRTGGVPQRPASSAVQQAGARAFFDNTMAELRKVVWPTKEERNSGTIVTIGLLVFFAAYILLLDEGIQKVFEALKILPHTS